MLLNTYKMKQREMQDQHVILNLTSGGLGRILRGCCRWHLSGKDWLFSLFLKTFAPQKLLSLGKAQKNLAFRSFFRNFGAILERG